jgi:hypothetical protein
MGYISYMGYMGYMGKAPGAVAQEILAKMSDVDGQHADDPR